MESCPSTSKSRRSFLLKSLIPLLLLLFSTSQSLAQEPPTQPYAWYRQEGIQYHHADVSAWTCSQADANQNQRTLDRIVGEPLAYKVQTPTGPMTVVRLNGSSALWQAVGSWGTLAQERTVVIFARVHSGKSGTLFDGSTRAGSTPVIWENDKWKSSAASVLSFAQGDWQVHTFTFSETGTPLGGFILGANVATKEGLACDVGEVLIYPRKLSQHEQQDVATYFQNKWGTPTDLPAELQPQPPTLYQDPRVFRTTIRKAGQDGVHTYRIPGLATTPNGSLIAVFDLRHQSAGDLPGDIDVGMMRSTDDGTTWSATQRIMDFDKAVPGSRGNGVGDPAVLVDQRTGAIFVAALWSQGDRAWNGSGPGMTPEETGQLVIVKSLDDGVTWSAPMNVTTQVKQPHWRLCFNGPGNGIQLRDGTLVFPAQYKDADNVPHSCFIASSDQGNSWTISPPAIPNSPPTSESSIVELADGALLLSMRNESRAGIRAWNRWDWQGKLMQGQWSESWLNVPDPTCMASLIRYPNGTLIFSNPYHNKRRVAMTIRTSTDDGRTWSAGRLLDPNGSMYSSLTVLKDGRIGILYESTDAAGLVFARFPLDWLEEGASVPNQPEARTQTSGKFGWWPARHTAKVAESKAYQTVPGMNVLFLGDSITQGWETSGSTAWNKYFAHLKSANYGFSGDSTQHVLWRVLNGECDGISPKAVVLLIGTNNLRHGDFTAEQITDGVQAILDALGHKCPESKVLVLGILPRGATPSDPLRRKANAVNALLPKLADNQRIHFMNINNHFLDPDGLLSNSISPDLLHLSPEGYEILAKQIEPKLKELINDR